VNTIAAYAPGHITGIFYIDDTSENPLNRGSLGAGFSIEQGVTTRIQTISQNPGPPEFYLNNKVSGDLNVSRQLYDHFSQSLSKRPHQQLKIEHTIIPPQSSGFGTSGAGALSLSLALNKYFGFPFTTEQASHFAHIAEIECRTGLGTVIGEYFGGFELRTVPGAPGVGQVQTFSYPRNLQALFAVRGPSLTSKALSDPKIRNDVNRAGLHNFTELRKNPTVKNFLYYSRTFSVETCLMTPWVETTLELLEKRGIIGSMLMFGEAVFSLAEDQNMPEITAILKDICRKTKTGEKISIFSTPINSTGGIYL